MNVLIGCEYSGTVRDEFIKLGHNAASCDLLPTDKPGPHFQCDIFDIMRSQKWDMLIFFPPCTYVCSSGLHWNNRIEGREQKTLEAIEFVKSVYEYAKSSFITKIAWENPIGRLSSAIRKPDQIIQPYQFGDDASKSTCLWLENLPLLIPTLYVDPRIINGKKRWGNQTDSGQNKLAPSVDRWKLRSETFPGIAKAMATQWG